VPDARVFAFEPLPQAIELFEINCAENPALSPRIHLNKLALSDRDGDVTLYETINDRGFLSTSSTLEQSFAEGIGEHRKSIIPTMTLDTWASRSNVRCGFVKIDVESHESSVVRGGREVLAKHRPLLLIEVLPSVDLTFLNQWCVEHDYLCYAPHPQGLLKLDRCSSVAGAPNQIFCPQERSADLLGCAANAGLMTS
jgi:FkbM family methyltransferase